MHNPAHLKSATCCFYPLSNGTVVVSGYSPSTSTLSDGSTITIAGSYPFSDTATVHFSHATTAQLRVPCFSKGAVVTVSSSGAPANAPPCAFFKVEVKVSAASIPLPPSNFV